jgi:hypothetical protein
MKAQKINEDSKRVQVGKLQKGTGEKPSQIADGTWLDTPLPSSLRTR